MIDNLPSAGQSLSECHANQILTMEEYTIISYTLVAYVLLNGSLSVTSAFVLGMFIGMIVMASIVSLFLIDNVFLIHPQDVFQAMAWYNTNVKPWVGNNDFIDVDDILAQHLQRWNDAVESARIAQMSAQETQ